MNMKTTIQAGLLIACLSGAGASLVAQQPINFNACSPGAGTTPSAIAQLNWSGLRAAPLTFPAPSASTPPPTISVGPLATFLASDGNGLMLASAPSARAVGAFTETQLLSPSLTISAENNTSAQFGVFDGTIFLWGGTTGQIQYVNGLNPNFLGTLAALPGPIAGMVYDGTYLWVSGAGMLNRITYTYTPASNPPTQVKGLLRIPFANAGALAYDGANLWVSTGTQLIKTDQNGKPLLTISVQTSSVLYDGAYLWTLSPGAASRYDPGTGNEVSVAEVLGATAAAFDGRYVWVISTPASTVTQIRACDGAVTGSYPVASPTSIIFNGTDVWVGSQTQQTLTKL
jgi:hypothetical protein